jgi:hypothetical protein
MADNLPPSSADVTESGSLNLPEPSGPHRPVMGLLYLDIPCSLNRFNTLTVTAFSINLVQISARIKLLVS